jgi:hypothetical protein
MTFAVVDCSFISCIQSGFIFILFFYLGNVHISVMSLETDL